MTSFCKLVKKNPTHEKNGVLIQAPLEKDPEDSLRYNMQCFFVRYKLKAERLMEIDETGRREENQGQEIKKTCPSDQRIEWECIYQFHPASFSSVKVPSSRVSSLPFKLACFSLIGKSVSIFVLCYLIQVQNLMGRTRNSGQMAGVP